MLPRNLLFIPALKAKDYSQNLNRYNLDGIIYDLEDSISFSHKKLARETLRSYLKENTPHNNIFIRINSVKDTNYDSDWQLVLEVKPNGILLPKVETLEDIQDVEKKIKDYKKLNGKDLSLFVAIETLRGYYNREEILGEAEKIDLFAVGYEDMSYSLGIDRPELFAPNPLNQILLNCIISAKMHNVPMIDAVSRKFKSTDLDALRKETEYGKSVGLFGKVAIHPNQINIINEVYRIDRLVDKSKQKIREFQKKDGISVIVNENGEMEDVPSLKLASERIEKIERLLKIT